MVRRSASCIGDVKIELCAVFRTLIADEDGIYDPPVPFSASSTPSGCRCRA